MVLSINFMGEGIFMRLSDVISMGGRYLLLGGILASVVLLTVLLGNRLIFKGKKTLDKSRLLWWVLFISYMVVVLGATLMERGNFWTNTKIMPLFYSYKEAWVSGLAIDWRNIILNICMFMPFGFLLPLGFRICKSFCITSLAGLLFTAVIEGAQLYYHLGMFELDDLMNNTVGTMIGFGFYMLYAKWILKREASFKRIVLAQIPFVITLSAFAGALIFYQVQELGNLPYACIIPFEKEKLSVSTNIVFSEEAGTAAVFKSSSLSKKEATTFAEEFFERLGTSVDESQNDYYDETAVFYDEERNYSLWVDYAGGTYRFTDFNASFNEQQSLKTDAAEAEVKDALVKYGIKVPNGVSMDFREDMDSFVFEYVQYEEDSCFLDGTLMVEYMDNGSISSLYYSVVTSEFYKEFPILSEKEAYEMICDGKFNYQMIDDLEIQVKSCSLEYMTDSKDFYQPIYQFNCEINGNEATIGIPAIRK